MVPCFTLPMCALFVCCAFPSCSVFCHRMVALMSPNESWVAKWQRIGKNACVSHVCTCLC